jgi:hypothetical protein
MPFRAAIVLHISFRRHDIRYGRPLFGEPKSLMAPVHRKTPGNFGRCSLPSGEPFSSNSADRTHASALEVLLTILRTPDFRSAGSGCGLILLGPPMVAVFQLERLKALSRGRRSISDAWICAHMALFLQNGALAVAAVAS